MKLNISLLLLLCLFFKAGAQEGMDFKPLDAAPVRVSVPLGLKVGNRVPEVVLAKVLNNDGIGIRLAGYRGKLLVLDFWATSCGACIEAMPRLDSLVERFGGRLAVLPVTAEGEGSIRAFQQGNRFLLNRNFRTVVEDKVLQGLFPHRLLPHLVWIGPDGRVLGFTSVEDVNPVTVQGVLDGKGLRVREKQDVLDYDPRRPLLVHNNGGDDTLYRYRSLMTGELAGLQATVGIRYDSVRRCTVVRAVNVGRRQLYTLVCKELRTMPDGGVDMGTDGGLYCYELDFPGRSPAGIRKKVKEDLDSFFGVRSGWTAGTFRLVPVAVADDHQGPLSL